MTDCTPTWAEIDRLALRSRKAMKIYLDACKLDAKLEKLGIDEATRRRIANAQLDEALKLLGHKPSE